MATKKPTKNSAPSITEVTKAHKKWTKGLKIERHEYEELRAELRQFALDRKAGSHELALSWFIHTGMPDLNARRAAAGLDPIRFDITVNPMKEWLRSEGLYDGVFGR